MYAKKEKNIYVSKQYKSWKASYCFNDSEWRKMTLSCSKKLSALLRGNKPKHHDDFYCPNCLHSFAIEKNWTAKKAMWKQKFCKIIMPSEETNVLEFSQYQTFDKAQFIIHADLECLIEKIDGCKNNSENSSALKVGKYISSAF